MPKGATVISVLIVDDSVSARRLMTDALTGVPDVRVVGSVADGAAALAKLSAKPDLVLLDVEMPGADAVTTLLALRRTHPQLPVVLLCPPGEQAAAAALDALAAGADDVVVKPAGSGGVKDSLQMWRASLLPRILAFGERRPGLLKAAPVRTLRPVAARVRAPREAPLELVAIGSATAGVAALASLLAELPAALAVPVLVAHDLPAEFAGPLVQRLAARSQLPVVLAQPLLPLEPGTVYLAPAGQHLSVSRRPEADVVLVSPASVESGPLDTMLRSVAIAYGPGALAIVVVATGEDGVDGARRLRAVGAEFVVRAEAGGPLAATGVADAVITGGELGEYVRTCADLPTPVTPVASGWR